MIGRVFMLDMVNALAGTGRRTLNGARPGSQLLNRFQTEPLPFSLHMAGESAGLLGHDLKEFDLEH